MLITPQRLHAFAPNARPEIVTAIVEGRAQLEAVGVTSPLRLCHFLSEVSTETGGLKSISESLNYSVAGLRATFGRHRISDADCARLGRQGQRRADQEGIANIVYGGEWGRRNLGNTEPGDGFRYRGAGMLQTTGRANFRRAGHEHDPDALRQPVTALFSALKFWSDNGLNALADRDDIVAVRKTINGGTNGLAEARKWLAAAKRVFV